MPKEVFDKDYAYLPHSHLLSFEEITRIATVFVGRGRTQNPLDGRRTPSAQKHRDPDCEQLAALRTPDGQPLDLTLTTNGSLLGPQGPKS